MENSPAIQRIQESSDKQIHWLRNNPEATVADYMRQAEASSADSVLEAVEQFRAELHNLQRRMDPLVEQYEGMKRIDTDEDERLHKALAMVWSAWWDITETVGYLRAADRRLRDGDGLPADIEKER